MSDAASRLPNLYQLLGLAPLEADRAKIAAAIERLQKLPKAETPVTGGSSEEGDRTAKIVALAQKYLLDPQRKQAYDQQWKAVYRQGAAADSSKQPAATDAAPVNVARQNAVKGAAGSSPSRASERAESAQAGASTAGVVAVAANPRWDYSKLDQLLPQGDPQAAFDMSNFLRTGGESRDPMAAQADLGKLIALLSGTTAAGEDGAAATDSVVIAQVIDQPAGLATSDSQGLALAPGVRAGQANASGGVLARRRRQRQQRALLLGGAVLVAGLGGLIMLGLYLFRPKPASTENQVAIAAQQKPKPARNGNSPQLGTTAGTIANAAPSGQQEQSAAQAGSGLPKPGEGAMNLAVDPSTTLARPSEATTTPPPEPNAPATATTATPPAMANAPANPATPMPEPETQPAPEVKPPDAPMAETQPAAPTPAAEPQLTSDEKRQWQQGMTEARQLIGKQDFAGAEKQLSELKPTAKTLQQRGQLERLEQVLGWVKDVRQAMVDAIGGLGPADTFKVGTSTASFVEGNDKRITIRIAGGRKSYSLEEVPVKLGLALADLKMDVENASSLARKGAYILTHPNNSLMLEQGKQMLQQAADAGAITPELARFYEDDYSLSGDTN